MPAPHHLLRHLETLVAEARKAGAESCDAMAAESRGLHIALREGHLTDIEQTENIDVGIRVLIGKRQASLSTSMTAPENLKSIAEQAVAMAKLAPEDPYAGLADPAQFAKNMPALECYDETGRTAEQLIAAASVMDDIARQNKAITNVEEASASHGVSSFAYLTSNGFAGGNVSSSHGIALTAIAGTGTEMVRDYDFSQALFLSDVEAPEKVANSAVQRTVSRLNARKMGTQSMPVVFGPRVSKSLVGHFLSGISGTSVARKSTFLADALGTDVFGPGIQIVEDPHLRRGLRSRAFDGEGLPTQKRALIENGKLTTWLLNCSAARQLGLASTGHASRSTSGVPGITTGNVYMQAGPLSPAELIKDIKTGFYVTETMGFGVNGLTGDFSQGAAGFWIENGQITFPVHEMTIAGNLKEMFKTLTPANDLEYRYGVDAPTVRLDNMMVAGA